MMFAEEIALRLNNSREILVHRWLDLIVQRSSLPREEVFPGVDLIDHMPLLIDGIAEYVAHPPVAISELDPVMAKAIELGRLRYQQGFEALDILKDNEVLGSVLFDFLVEEAKCMRPPPAPVEVALSAQRVFQSIALIQQHTTKGFLELNEKRVSEREQRLRGFNRMVSHELKNRMGAALMAAEVLKDGHVRPESEQYVDLIVRNLSSLNETTDDLIQLTHSTEPGNRAARSEPLPDLLDRIMAELREFANVRGVRIEATGEIPPAEVPAVATELALRNLLSNAAKYRDEAKQDRWVRIECRLHQVGGKCDVEIRVRDNGIGVREKERSRLFERFFRADGAAGSEEGVGLGLAIVRETLETQGGRVWAEFPKEGTTFVVIIPCSVPERKA